VLASKFWPCSILSDLTSDQQELHAGIPQTDFPDLRQKNRHRVFGNRRNTVFSIFYIVGYCFFLSHGHAFVMASENVFELTGANFSEKVLNNKGLVLVDFWAEWCGPCKMIAPLLDQIADGNIGKVQIGKVDVDKNPELSSQYNIRAIPTLLIFEDGKVKEQIVGMTSKASLEQKLGLV